MEETGQPYNTDGEQRASSFATYPIVDTLGGAGLAEHLAPDGQYLCVLLLSMYAATLTGDTLAPSSTTATTAASRA